MIFIFVFLFIILSVMIIFPPSKGEIPKFYDDNRNVLPNSVAEKYFLEVDEEKLGMIISAKDISNPVLLVCGGGPGIP